MQQERKTASADAVVTGTTAQMGLQSNLVIKEKDAALCTELQLPRSRTPGKHTLHWLSYDLHKED